MNLRIQKLKGTFNWDMNLMKIGLLLGIIAPSKSRKHVPTPIWIREKERHLIKIEDTHQEEEATFQETMTTSVEDLVA